MPPTFAFDDPVLRLSSVDNIAIAAWFDAPPEPAYLERTTAFLKALHARHPGGIAFVNLICGGTPRFSEPVRKATTASMRDVTVELGTAHVVLIGGFRGTATRMFLSSMMLLSRPPHPSKICVTVDEALAWMLPHCGAAAPDRAAVTAVCDRIITR